MSNQSPNQISVSVDLNASSSRVWEALTDSQRFGSWFGVKIETPFQLGKDAVGKITHPGYEHVTWRVKVEKIEFERLFAFSWHPYAVDLNHDYSAETPTLCAFRLEKTDGGTRLMITETGFDQIPAARRDEAYRKNHEGWLEQARRIETYLGKNS